MKVNREHFKHRLAQAPGAHAANGLRSAAVLVPVVDRAEPTVLFTLRTDHLPTHAGQVCFPGGRVHDDDDGAVATALRETHEEIGVTADHIEVLGFLDPYNTGTGYSVIPVVGFVHPDHTLAPNIHEVAEVFEVPLDYLCNMANWDRLQRQSPSGHHVCSWQIEFGGHLIWGATARMVEHLIERLRD